MTTIDDKVKLFYKVVIDKVEKESQQKLTDKMSEYNKQYEIECEKVLKESEAIVKQMKKKAELKGEQIISKANTDRQHTLLKKRKELFDRTMDDIRNMARRYVKQPQYTGFLEKAVISGINKIDSQNIVLFFMKDDISSNIALINEIIDKCKNRDVNIEIKECDRDIIGGCIIENMDKTIRIDCSFASIIDENRVIIGKTLVESIG